MVTTSGDFIAAADQLKTLEDIATFDGSKVEGFSIMVDAGRHQLTVRINADNADFQTILGIVTTALAQKKVDAETSLQTAGLADEAGVTVEATPVMGVAVST